MLAAAQSHCVSTTHVQRIVASTRWYVSLFSPIVDFLILTIQIAKNPQGHVETSARVDVQDTPGIDETSYVQPDAFKYIEKQPGGLRRCLEDLRWFQRGLEDSWQSVWQE